jgi:hypothetical protein
VALLDTVAAETPFDAGAATANGGSLMVATSTAIVANTTMRPVEESDLLRASIFASSSFAETDQVCCEHGPINLTHIKEQAVERTRRGERMAMPSAVHGAGLTRSVSEEWKRADLVIPGWKAQGPGLKIRKIKVNQ